MCRYTHGALGAHTPLPSLHTPPHATPLSPWHGGGTGEGVSEGGARPRWGPLRVTHPSCATTPIPFLSLGGGERGGRGTCPLTGALGGATSLHSLSPQRLTHPCNP